MQSKYDPNLYLNLIQNFQKLLPGLLAEQYKNFSALELKKD